MSQIEITCIDQTSIFTNTPEIFSGDVNVDTVKFKFDDSWDDYIIKTAVFYNDVKEVYTQELNESYVAVIPKEVMTKKCKLSIGVFGTNVNGDVKTSKILTYNIGKGAISDDLGTNPPTLDVWVQLLTRIVMLDDELNKRQDDFEDEITDRQTTFENNITQQQNAFETNMEREFNSVTNDVETLEGIVKGRNQALAYNSYSEMITALNGMSTDELKRGQNIYIGTVGVPDLWVYGVEETNVEYTYVDDESIVDTLDTNTTIQVGYYTLAQLETQKVDLTNIESEIDALESDVTDLTDRVVEIETNGGGGGSTPSEGVSNWELWGNVTSGNKIVLPSEWEEVNIVMYDNSKDDMIINTTYNYNMLKNTCENEGITSIDLGVPSSNNRVIYDYTNNSITPKMLSGSINENVTTSVYYKKKSPITVNVGTESNWALCGSVTGSNEITLPSEWEEISLVVTVDGEISTTSLVYDTYTQLKNSNTIVKLNLAKETTTASIDTSTNKIHLYLFNGTVLNEYHPHVFEVYYKKKCDNVLDINDMGEWKLVGSFTGGNYVYLPSDFKELFIVTQYTDTAKGGTWDKIVIKDSMSYYHGNVVTSYISTNLCQWTCTNTYVQLKTCMSNSNNILTSYPDKLITCVYYR